MAPATATQWFRYRFIDKVRREFRLEATRGLGEGDVGEGAGRRQQHRSREQAPTNGRGHIGLIRRV